VQNIIRFAKGADMSAESIYVGIGHTVQINSNIGKSCEHCGHQVGFPEGDLGKDISHYVEKNGYRLLHIGTETDKGDAGLEHYTIAIVGK
jgi:hypothetical protein